MAATNSSRTWLALDTSVCAISVMAWVPASRGAGAPLQAASGRSAAPTRKGRPDRAARREGLSYPGPITPPGVMPGWCAEQAQCDKVIGAGTAVQQQERAFRTDAERRQ